MRIPAVIAALALAAVAVLGVAGPASAHDQLLSTSPGNGATVTTLPTSITLTFSDTVQNAGAEANQVKVMDASCTVLNSGPVQIQDNVVTQPIAGDATGQITVLWRVVSRDGHPVSNQFTFTVGSGQAAASPDSSCSADAAAPPATAAPASDTVLPWVIGGGVVVVLAAMIVLLITRSKRAGDR